MVLPHSPPQLRSAWLPVVGLCAVLLLVWAGSSWTPVPSGSHQWLTLRQPALGTGPLVWKQHGPATRKPVPLAPTYDVINGTEVVWQVPPNPRGVLLVFHGCNHGAIDWWPKHDGCQTCIGLPVEVNITTEALARGYAVLALSSWDREESRCWEAGSTIVELDYESYDVTQTVLVLSRWLPDRRLQHLPVYALGVSSGGNFALHLAMGKGIRLAGVCSQVMGAQTNHITNYLGALARAEKGDGGRAASATSLPLFPPTMYVHMPRDQFTARVVKANIEALRNGGVAVEEVEVGPQPLTPTTLAAAAPLEINPEQGAAIHAALKYGFGGEVPHVELMRLDPDESAVAELLNVLFAGHEIVSSTTTQMLDWFEAQPYQEASAT